jgi:hypothetical protein
MQGFDCGFFFQPAEMKRMFRLPILSAAQMRRNTAARTRQSCNFIGCGSSRTGFSLSVLLRAGKNQNPTG